jgi:hypothetical protein
MYTVPAWIVPVTGVAALLATAFLSPYFSERPKSKDRKNDRQKLIDAEMAARSSDELQ